MSVILVTGVCGEVGTSIVRALSKNAGHKIIGLDIRDPDPVTRARCTETFKADIADPSKLIALGAKYNFDEIFHLAGILSSGGERNPLLAHQVNVTGTLNILELARIQGEERGSAVKVILASTIAVYGVPNLEVKSGAGAVHEEMFQSPVTMYGANKLYCESLGSYYSRHFGMLNEKSDRTRVDFRCVRFPGLLNSHTLPTGGTSDYAPEMVHRLAQGIPYECFVRPDSRIPFMMMPDAIRALLVLSDAPAEKLSRTVYNIRGFSPSAEEIRVLLNEHFPGIDVTYKPHAQRQAIVDSWPEEVDDTAARNDWKWRADYSFESGFSEYLIPEVIEQYRNPHVANA